MSRGVTSFTSTTIVPPVVILVIVVVVVLFTFVTFDAAISLTLFLVIVFLLPAIVLICLCILVSYGRPVFYRQKRIGRDGRVFECLKFRTMRRDASLEVETSS